MFVPNLYTLVDKSQKFGLHRFQDGKVYLVQQHSSGDWQTVRYPTEAELTYFKKQGSPVLTGQPTV